MQDSLNMLLQLLDCHENTGAMRCGSSHLNAPLAFGPLHYQGLTLDWIMGVLVPAYSLDHGHVISVGKF